VTPQVIDLGSGYTVNVYDNNHANILKDGKDIFNGLGGVLNTQTGKITTLNITEAEAALQTGSNPQDVAYSISMPSDYPVLTLDNIKNLTPEDITAIKQNVESVAKVITSKTAADYNQAISNGMSSEAALAAASSANGGAMLHEFSRIGTNITNNTKAIQSNSRQLQEHNARLNDHQRQIRENHEEMKRAAAQSAALAGLFQPYSVGKFNATAALGGYSDKQAVAVGVGYRFNEQTAAKAGIAASDGDVSYNVGVNFEF
ncbi:YadA C-terminal domain-containing protein, partial [Escherichia coli]|nr:YadA C-terminal domain-containing protein [Escherichia coli]